MRRHNFFEEHICDKYLDLVEKKPFDRIKVKELVEYAEISRSSFYLYFDSIYDVVQKIEDDLIEGFLPTEDAIKIMVNGDISIAHQQNEYLKANARKLDLLLGRNGDPLFEHKLNKKFIMLSEAIWGKNKADYSPQMKDWLSYYLATGNIAFIKWSISHIGKYSDEELIQMLNMLMKDTARLLSGRVDRYER